MISLLNKNISWLIYVVYPWLLWLDDCEENIIIYVFMWSYYLLTCVVYLLLDKHGLMNVF